MSDYTIEVTTPSYVIDVVQPSYVIDVSAPVVNIDVVQPAQTIEVLVPAYTIEVGAFVEGGGVITLEALLTLLGCASYVDVATANAAIGEINVPYFNTTNNRIENTTSAS